MPDNQLTLREASRALPFLPVLCKKILLRHYIQQKSIDDIAGELQLTPHKVNNMLRKTIRLVRSFSKEKHQSKAWKKPSFHAS